MSAMASQITSLMIVYWTIYSSADRRKYQSFCVTGLCEGDSPVTGELPPQRTSNVENVSIWWRHHTLMYHKNDSKHMRIYTYSSNGLFKKITTTLHERYGVSIHRQIPLFFGYLFRLTSKRNQVYITGPLWWDFTKDWWIPLSNSL